MGTKPKTEIDLENLQRDYLETKSAAAWQQMYEILISYARSLTLKMTKGRKFIDEDRVVAVSVDAATKIMSRYLEQDNFFIKDSFGGLLKWKVLETLYDSKQRKIDSELSLNHSVGDNSDRNVELGELTEKFHIQAFSHNESYEPELAFDSGEDLFRVIQKTLVDFDMVAPYHLQVIARPYLLMFLRKPRVKNWKETYEKTFSLDFKEVKALESLLEEIQKRFT